MSWEHSHNRYGDSHAGGHSRNLYGTHLGPSYTNQTYNYYGSAWDQDRQPRSLPPQAPTLNKDAAPLELVQVATYDYVALPADSVRIAHVRARRTQNMQISFEAVHLNELGRRCHYTALSLPRQRSQDSGTLLEVCSSVTAARDASPKLNEKPLGTLLVSSYLGSILEQLSSQEIPDGEEHISLWTGELCTDSANTLESSQSKLNLSTIFEKADRVDVWLGPGTWETDHALEFLPRCSLFDKVEDATVPDSLASFNCFMAVLELPIFNNRWLVQQLAFAQEITLRCGTRSMPWQVFCDSMVFFRTHIVSLQKAAKLLPDLSRLNPDNGDLESLPAISLAGGIEKISRKTRTPESNLEIFLHFFENVGVDRVSCNEQMCDNALRPLRRINGRFSTRRLEMSSKSKQQACLLVHIECIEFVVGIVGAQGDIDIFCRPWVFPPPEQGALHVFQYPSWMQSIERSPYGMPKAKIRQRLNGDSFVGGPGSPRYNASQGQKGLVWFGNGVPSLPMERASSDTRRSGPGQKVRPSGYAFRALNNADSAINWAMLDGWKVGRVVWSTDPVAEAVIPARAIERIWSLGSSTAIPDKMWRILVADRDSEGKHAPSWYRNACRQSMDKRSANGHINTKAILANDPSEAVQRYLRRVQATIWNRCFFELEAHDRTLWHGLGPAEMSVGDYIAVLRGCSVPVAIRPHGRPGPPLECSLVGETYVHGIMDGETIEGPIGPEWEPATTSTPTRFVLY